jgi:ABC-type sugar transport system permease subunit
MSVLPPFKFPGAIKIMYPLRQNTGKWQYTPYLVLLPALLFFLFFQVFPSVGTVIFSFTDISRTGHTETQFVGLANYKEFFRPATFQEKGIALKNTVIFTVFVTALQNGIALAVALVLNRKWRGRAFFRAIIFLPILLGITVNALTWKLMFNPFDGPVQKVVQTVLKPMDYRLTYSSLRKLQQEELSESALEGVNAVKNKTFSSERAFWAAIEQESATPLTPQEKTTILSYAASPRTLKFFADPQWAFALIIFVQVWSYMGYSCVIFLAGLQAIPKALYEASDIDGAGKVAQFMNVTFPLIAQAVTVNVLLSIIGAMRTFDTIYVTTNGQFDTQTMAFYMFNQAFQSRGGAGGGRLGFASSVATLLFIFIFVVAVIMQWYLRRREVEL